MARDQDQNPKPRRDPLVKWTIIGFVVVIVLLALYGGYRYTLKRAVQTRLDELRAAGYPVTAAEVDAAYKQPPPGQNAAEVQLDANRLIVLSQELREQIPGFSSSVKLPTRSEPIPAPTLRAMQTAIEQNQKALAKLREAIPLKQSRYPIDLSESVDALLPHLGDLRENARLLSIELHVHVEKGDLDAAVESVQASVAVTESLREEPLLISQLVRISIGGLLATNLERALSRRQFNAEQLARIQEALARMEDPTMMHRTLAGERAIMLEFFFRPAEMIATFSGSMYSSFGPLVLLSRAAGVMDLDQLAFIDAMQAYLDALALPMPARLAAADAAEANLVAVPRIYLITRLITPALGSAIKAQETCSGLLLCTRTALAVERYRLDQGELPQDLADLVPRYLDAVPSDPFDGKPLRYLRLDVGYRVYSVGPDGADDGGVGSINSPEPDITFTVER